MAKKLKCVWSWLLSLAMCALPLGPGGLAFGQGAKAPAKAPAAKAPATKAPAKKAAPATAPAPAAPAAPATPATEAPEAGSGEGSAGIDAPEAEEEVSTHSTKPPPDGSKDKLWGMVILGIGAAIGIGGVVMIVKSENSVLSNGSVVPIVLVGIGALSFIPGFVFLNRGDQKQQRFERWKEDQSDGGSASREPIAPGLAWTFHF